MNANQQKSFDFQRGYVFQGDSWPTWARKDMWAPEIHFVNGRFMVYFSARRDLLLCIGVAISKDPLNPFGPYEDFGEPISIGFRIRCK